MAEGIPFLFKRGRLFWKIFVSLWLALVLMAAGIDFVVDKYFHTEWPFATELLALTLSSLLFSMGITRYLCRPLHQLREANRRLGEGDLTVRVKPLIGTRSDEVADLGRDFDTMASRLQAAVEGQKRLMYDVSHELRSPLARMSVSLALARQKPEKVAANLDRIDEEILRLDNLIGGMLLLSRIEANSGDVAEQQICLRTTLANIVEQVHFEAEYYHRHVELKLTEDHAGLCFAGSNELLRRAFENVLRNAIQHTPINTTVEVSLNLVADGWAEIVVSDQGPGIPEDEIGRIFEEFYRAKGPVEKKGAGLGLAIAHRAIVAHGGMIRAQNLVGGGLSIIIRLPVLSAAA